MAGPGAQLVKCLSSMRKARFGPRHHINPVSAHACSPSTWGMRVWKFEAQSQFGYIGSLRPELYETPVWARFCYMWASAPRNNFSSCPPLTCCLRTHRSGQFIIVGGHTRLTFQNLSLVFNWSCLGTRGF